jgi:glucan-binding YG repeat protein
MKTIAQQLNVKEFPFEIKDKNGNRIYFEKSNGYFVKSEYDSNGNQIYFEDSDGYILDNRPKSCEGKVVEIDGKKYKLTEV